MHLSSQELTNSISKKKIICRAVVALNAEIHTSRSWKSRMWFPPFQNSGFLLVLSGREDDYNESSQK